MRIPFETISGKTKEQLQLLDITQMVREFLTQDAIRNGVLLLSTLHTTAVLFINEFQAAPIEDMKKIPTTLIEDNAYYRHNDPSFRTVPGGTRVLTFGPCCWPGASRFQFRRARWSSVAGKALSLASSMARKSGASSSRFWASKFVHGSRFTGSHREFERVASWFSP